MPDHDPALMTRIAETHFRKALIGLDMTYFAFKDEILKGPRVNKEYINSKYTKSYTDTYSQRKQFVETQDGTLERLYNCMDEWERKEYDKLRAKASSLKELKK